MSSMTEKGKMIEEFRATLEQHTDEVLDGVVSKLTLTSFGEVAKLCGLVGFLSGTMTGGLWGSDLETIESRLKSLKEMISRY
jgi:hypothetical protein